MEALNDKHSQLTTHRVQGLLVDKHIFGNLLQFRVEFKKFNYHLVVARKALLDFIFQSL